MVLRRAALAVSAAVVLAACGGSGSSPPPAGGTSLPARLYVGNDASPGNSVSVFAIDPDGALSPLAGSPFATGGDAADWGGMSNCIRIHKASHRLYAVNTDSLSVFAIDGRTGALSLLPGAPAPVGAGHGPMFYSLEVSSDGDTVFLPDINTDTIYAVRVGADGSVTDVPGSPFASRSAGADIAELGRDGRFLYAFHDGNAEFDAFAVTTVLTPVAGGPWAYGGGFTVRRSHDGHHLALGESSGAGIAVFALDAATGVPTTASGSPFAGPGETSALAWSPDDARFYAGDWNTSLYGYTVAAGALAPIAGSPWTLDGVFGPLSGLEITSDGKFMYAVTEDAELAAFRLDPSGVPTAVRGSPFTTTGTPSFLLSTP